MRKRVHKKWLVFLLTLLVAMALIASALDVAMRPLVREYAINNAKTMASEAMALAMESVLSNHKTSGLTQVERNEEGAILSVQADTAAINSFSTEVVAVLSKTLSRDEYTRMTVPVLNATGSAFLMGRGPRITITIQQNGAATVKINSTFSSAGINQTIHRLELTLTFRVIMLMAGMSEEIETTGSFLIAETVIVGTVPELYADITRG